MIEKKKKIIWKRWWMIVIYVFIGLMIIGVFLPNTETSNSSQGDLTDNLDTQTQKSTNNYQDCIKNIFKTECQKYNLLYTDYSSYAEFFTCTDDGSYTLDDIGDDSKYLQIYAPTRSLEIKCETYEEPTNSKLKCEEDLFESKCQQVELIYTDWSSAVGFITCTDDGIYILDEIGSKSKYQQVYITSEFVDSQCS